MVLTGVELALLDNLLAPNPARAVQELREQLVSRLRDDALDPSNPLTPAAIHVLTGDRRRRPDARLRPRASGDDTPAHGIPRPLAATR